MTPPEGRKIRCVGALVYDAQGRLLLVQRANDPGRGRWSLPGGKVQAGETDTEAIVRELREETGLVVTPGRLAGVVTRPAPDGVFEIHDYFCQVTGGALAPGDDASDARWTDRVIFAALPLVELLEQTLTAWEALPRS
jgi:ADP-ribose pyrophosphatase YjhB (NUDIX family)